jgi:hypothetical protein
MAGRGSSGLETRIDRSFLDSASHLTWFDYMKSGITLVVILTALAAGEYIGRSESRADKARILVFRSSGKGFDLISDRATRAGEIGFGRNSLHGIDDVRVGCLAEPTHRTGQVLRSEHERIQSLKRQGLIQLSEQLNSLHLHGHEDVAIRLFQILRLAEPCVMHRPSRPEPARSQRWVPAR